MSVKNGGEAVGFLVIYKELRYSKRLARLVIIMAITYNEVITQLIVFLCLRKKEIRILVTSI
jgi:hypothetical protein